MHRDKRGLFLAADLSGHGNDQEGTNGVEDNALLISFGRCLSQMRLMPGSEGLQALRGWKAISGLRVLANETDLATARSTARLSETRHTTRPKTTKDARRDHYMSLNKTKCSLHKCLASMEQEVGRSPCHSITTQPDALNKVAEGGGPILLSKEPTARIESYLDSRQRKCQHGVP